MRHADPSSQEAACSSGSFGSGCLVLRVWRDRAIVARTGPLNPFYRQQRKPAWVRREVIRLKALLPDAGCRTIAATFNRRFSATKRMTVGKSFVAEVIRDHRYEIEVLRRKIKNAKPRPLPRNLLWALDLTGKTDTTGRTHVLFGLLDGGSRATLMLTALAEKSSWTLLGHVFLAIGRYGKPRTLKTDNDPALTSRQFRLVL